MSRVGGERCLGVITYESSMSRIGLWVSDSQTNDGERPVFKKIPVCFE